MKSLAGFYVISFGTKIGINVDFKFIQSMAKKKQLFIIHLRKLFLLLQAALLVSCIPVIGQFYVPSLEHGEEGVYSGCFDNGKTPIGIRFYKDGIKIETVFVYYRDAMYLKVLIQIPESETVQLHKHAAKLYFDGNPLPLKVKFSEISMVNPIYLQGPNKWTMGIDKLMIGERKRVTGPGGSFEYNVNFWLVSKLATQWASKIKDREVELIRVALPGLVINGAVRKFPEMRFERKWVKFMGFINC